MHAARRRIGIVLSGALGAMALMASPAAAAGIDKPWEVGGYIVSSTYDNDSTIQDTFAWGVRGSWRIKGPHLLELTYEIQSADNATKGSDITFDINKWTLNYLHDFKVKKPDAKLIPLMLFGFGTMAYDNGTDSDTTTVIQGGLGVRYLIKPWFALRFDGKIFHYHGDGPIIPRHGFFGFDLDVGVSFLFGTPKK